MFVCSYVCLCTEKRLNKLNCSSGSSDAILELINNGANVFAEDKDGLTGISLD